AESTCRRSASMPNTNTPYQEHPSTYLVEDRSNPEEMERLLIQDRLLTTLMGGVLPEQETTAGLRRVLDVGCGTGGWLIETARSYPSIEKLVGVDISRMMLAYAWEQAELALLGDRMRFQMMDALRILAFPSG